MPNIHILLLFLGLFLSIFGCMALAHLIRLGRRHGIRAVEDEVFWWMGIE